MKVICLCGHENHIEMPFDDPRTVRISCTNACRAARQLKLSLSPLAPVIPIASGYVSPPNSTPFIQGMLRKYDFK